MPLPPPLPTVAVASPAHRPPPTDAVPHAAVAAPSVGIALTRALAVTALFALIALGLAWELVLAPTGNRTLAIKVLPLAFGVVGLLKYRLYTYRWLSLLVWLYVVEGAVRASGDSGISQLLAVAEVLLCVLLFVACALHVRWRLRAGVAHPSLDASDVRIPKP